MMRARLALLLSLVAGPALAQLQPVDATRRPACVDGKPWSIWLLNESSSSDCDAVAGGTSEAFCCCKDGAVAACASGGGGSSNSFETIDLPAGTDPVADSGTDTLAVTCAAPLTCTGNSGTDTWALAWTSTPLIAADIDTSAELRGILTDETGTGAAVFVGCTNCLGGTEINESSLGVVPTASDLTCTNCIGGPEIDEETLVKISPYGEYDPDRPPSSCAVCEEWTNNTATQTWAWGNQESSTETLELDGATLSHPTDSTGFAFRYLTGPDGSSTDWTVTTKVTPAGISSFNAIGLGLLSTGTVGTPTKVNACWMVVPGTTYKAAAESYSSYTSSATGIGTADTIHEGILHPLAHYLQLRYTTSTKALNCLQSMDGKVWISLGSTTLAAHPTTTMGLLVASFSAANPGAGHVSFWRARTGANRNDAGE